MPICVVPVSPKTAPLPRYCVTGPRSSTYWATCRGSLRRYALFRGPSLHAAFVGAPCQRGFARTGAATPCLGRGALRRARCRGFARMGAARRVRDGSCAPNALPRSGRPQKQGIPPSLQQGAVRTPKRRRGCCFEGRAECAAAFRRTDGALFGAPNERRMKGGFPETAPRHSDGWAESLKTQEERGSVTQYLPKCVAVEN